MPRFLQWYKENKQTKKNNESKSRESATLKSHIIRDAKKKKVTKFQKEDVKGKFPNYRRENVQHSSQPSLKI